MLYTITPLTMSLSPYTPLSLFPYLFPVLVFHALMSTHWLIYTLHTFIHYHPSSSSSSSTSSLYPSSSSSSSLYPSMSCPVIFLLLLLLLLLLLIRLCFLMNKHGDLMSWAVNHILYLFYFIYSSNHRGQGSLPLSLCSLLHSSPHFFPSSCLSYKRTKKGKLIKKFQNPRIEYKISQPTAIMLFGLYIFSKYISSLIV